MLFSAENDKRWFLSSNYTDPKVIELLDEVARVFSDDQQITETIKFYKSGRAKIRDEFVRHEKPQGYYTKESLPLLPSTREYERRANSFSGQIKHYSSVAVIILLTCVVFLYYLRRKRHSQNEST